MNFDGGKVRVYIATSLDGFIAGPEDDLSWLPGGDLEDGAQAESSEPDPGMLGFDEFFASVGSMLMGRRTYDVVRGFDVDWPYGDTPVLVVTHRPLDADPPPFVQAVRGGISELVDQALGAAKGRDVYLDGGNLIRQAAEQDLIDDWTITLAPVALGEGIPLFAGLERHYPLEIVSHHAHPGGMVQIRARPRTR